MKKTLLSSLPVVCAAALSALFSFALLGQTHLLSSLFGADYLHFAADAAFFVLTALYALALQRARSLLRPRLFGCFIAALNAVLAALLLLLLLPR